jgi:hypothetical protein
MAKVTNSYNISKHRSESKEKSPPQVEGIEVKPKDKLLDMMVSDPHDFSIQKIKGDYGGYYDDVPEEDSTANKLDAEIVIESCDPDEEVSKKPKRRSQPGESPKAVNERTYFEINKLPKMRVTKASAFVPPATRIVATAQQGGIRIEADESKEYYDGEEKPENKYFQPSVNIFENKEEEFSEKDLIAEIRSALDIKISKRSTSVLAFVYNKIDHSQNKTHNIRMNGSKPVGGSLYDHHSDCFIISAVDIFDVGLFSFSFNMTVPMFANYNIKLPINEQIILNMLPPINRKKYLDWKEKYPKETFEIEFLQMTY